MELSINILSVDINEWLRNGPNNRGVGGGTAGGGGGNCFQLVGGEGGS